MGSLVPDEYNTQDLFKLNSCVLHPTGMLLLDGEAKEFLVDDRVLVHPIFETKTTTGSVLPDALALDVESQMYADDYDDDEDDGPCDEIFNTPVRNSDNADSSMPVVDSAVFLDPFDTSHNRICPFKRGTTHIQSNDSITKKLLDYSNNVKQGCFLDNRWIIPQTGPLFKEFQGYYDLENMDQRKRRCEGRKKSAPPTDIANAQPDMESEDETEEFTDFDAGFDNDDPVDNTPGYYEPMSLNMEFEKAASQDYEALCRSHITAFMSGAEQFTKETNLSRQVENWQSKLHPILEEESQHPPFDIHSCGKEIVDILQEEINDRPESIDFQNVVEGKSAFEVCRMFLASLQLANNGNVELNHGKFSEEQIKVPLKLLLLRDNGPKNVNWLKI